MDLATNLHLRSSFFTCLRPFSTPKPIANPLSSVLLTWKQRYNISSKASATTVEKESLAAERQKDIESLATTTVKPGLGVGGVRVPISEDIFRLTESGDEGVIIDTGTVVTRLPTVAYEALRDAFTAKTSRVPRAPSISIFDNCYLLYSDDLQVPSISFYFSGGPIITLASYGFLIPIDVEETLCFAFAPSTSGLSIIVNVQQTGIQISIGGYIGFGPNVC
ncbi:hypothetical protein Dsin_022378 [Dipteronia sinensis]|uniref:Xylanase inhibitor C-terminal domain-containing protein n=1 Tax=Dipteronia sinensis TaxID=43782 RepID=A0AAE0A1M6_9ROSI|nr:hypothetical protein Dsin_022378 [Dipteronia sinensis]